MADDCEELERFGMENEYEGGEFYYRSKKERPVQTREEAIYGAVSLPMEEGGLISKPVQFVFTGTVMPSQEIKRDPQEDGGRSAGVPNSFRGLGYGLGFQASREETEGVEDEDEDLFLPMAFGRKIEKGAQQREKEKELEEGKSKSAKKPSGRRDACGASDRGKFEEHTEGIGLRLMKMKGYKEV